MKFVIITKKKWNIKNFSKLDNNFAVLKNYNYNKIKKLNPKILFFIHWSKRVPYEIYSKFLCIQFHTSDLPKFKGGSPIQNQILRGIKKTKITAFKISKQLDNGDICLKRNFILNGNAKDIFIRMEKICIEMILKIKKLNKLVFKKQIGKSSFYKRRKLSESELKFKKEKNLKYIYDFVRANDAPGYPAAFINYNNFKLELYDAKLVSKKLYAKIKISKK